MVVCGGGGGGVGVVVVVVVVVVAAPGVCRTQSSPPLTSSFQKFFQVTDF